MRKRIVVRSDPSVRKQNNETVEFISENHSRRSRNHKNHV